MQPASECNADRPIELLARALWIESGCVLLCRNIAGGYWYLPGGHVEFGEAAGEALRREMQEEAGVAVRIGGCALVGESSFVQNGMHRHEVNLMFHVERDTPPKMFHVEHAPASKASLTVPPPISSLEPHIAFDWIPVFELAQVDVRPRWLGDWILANATGVSRHPQPSCPAWVSVMNTIS